MPRRQSIAICDLGRSDYLQTWNLQKDIQQVLVQAKRTNPPTFPDHVLLLVEHPPVYTLGKSGDESNLLVSETELEAAGATYYKTNRGGDITFHGPGQIVAYPILDLGRIFTDVGKYLRLLEESVILTCASYGIPTDRIPGKTGVWIIPETQSPRKICAMGIHCSRWVTMHGLAFNVNTALEYFSNIIPCGISDGEVTSLAQECGKAMDIEEVKNRWINHFTTLFDLSRKQLDKQQSVSFLQKYSGINGNMP